MKCVKELCLRCEKPGFSKKPGSGCADHTSAGHTEKLLPQPHERVTFGLLNVKPRFSRPS